MSKYYNLFFDIEYIYNTDKEEKIKCSKMNGKFNIRTQKSLKRIILKNVYLKNIEKIIFLLNGNIINELTQEMLIILRKLDEIEYYQGNLISMDVTKIFANVFDNIPSMLEMKIIGNELEELEVDMIITELKEIKEQHQIQVPCAEIIETNSDNISIPIYDARIQEIYFLTFPEDENNHASISNVNLVLMNYNRFNHSGEFLNKATFLSDKKKQNKDRNLYYYRFGDKCLLNFNSYDNSSIKINFDGVFNGKVLIFYKSFNILEYGFGYRYYMHPFINYHNFVVLEKVLEKIEMGLLKNDVCPISHEEFNLEDKIVVQCSKCKKNFKETFFNEYIKYVGFNICQQMECPYCRVKNIFKRLEVITEI